MAEEQRYVLGVAYQAGPDPRIRKGEDGGRDFISAEELEKAAWSFMADGGRMIGIEHADGTTGSAQPVESFLWRWDPLDLGDGVVIRKGDWLLGAILDERAWQMYKAGEITGWSPQGTARRLRASPGS